MDEQPPQDEEKTHQHQPHKENEQLEQVDGDQTKPEDGAQQKHEHNLLDLELELPQRPRSLGSNAIQESADYVLQLLHAYAAAFGL